MKPLLILALCVALVAVAKGQGAGPPDTAPPESTEAPEASEESTEAPEESTEASEESAEGTTAAPPASNEEDDETSYRTRFRGAWANNYTILACEGTVAKLSCPDKHYINVYEAFWGRADSETCKTSDGNMTARCNNEYVVNVVIDECDGRTDCQFSASSGNLGYMCNTPKYLKVVYQCYAPLYHALLCERSGSMDLTCPEGKYIEIQRAFWGRKGEDICPHSNLADLDCVEPNAYALTSQMCDGSASCKLEATTDLYGQPCAATHKYLKVDYTCAECLNAHDSDADCEYWAALGDCNDDWMRVNCRMTCWKCGTPEQQAASCVDMDDNCPEFAEDGECESNPVWMHAYCKKSCLRCDNLTPCRNVAEEDACEDWAENTDQCKVNVYWMHQHCAKSCWDCEKPYIQCRDRNTNCEEWANAGECSSNTGYMLPYCTKSCMQCTEDPVCENLLDSEALCEYWASIGECERNGAYMYKQCWKSCMACGDVAPCVNWYGDDQQCEIWKSQGECDNNMAWMTAFCKKTCLECDLNCINMRDDDYCEYNAGRGRCELDPINMHQRCLKTCQKCDDPKACKNRAGDDLCEYWASSGECTSNHGWMYTNCRLSCTRCAAVTNPKPCVDTEDDCGYWAENGECIANPWYMIPTCKMSCTKCGGNKVVQVGSSPFPGDTSMITRGSTILVPDSFPTYGRLININAFFATTAPVHLQVWRYDSGRTEDGGWYTVFDERVTPMNRNTAQTTAATWSCFQIWTGDKLGFTTFGNTSPISAKLDIRNVFKTTYFHDAGTNRGFVKIGMPYTFSISAELEIDGTC